MVVPEVDQRSTCFRRWQQRFFSVFHNHTEVCLDIIGVVRFCNGWFFDNFFDDSSISRHRVVLRILRACHRVVYLISISISTRKKDIMSNWKIDIANIEKYIIKCTWCTAFSFPKCGYSKYSRHVNESYYVYHTCTPFSNLWAFIMTKLYGILLRLKVKKVLRALRSGLKDIFASSLKIIRFFICSMRVWAHKLRASAAKRYMTFSFI